MKIIIFFNHFSLFRKTLKIEKTFTTPVTKLQATLKLDHEEARTQHYIW